MMSEYKNWQLNKDDDGILWLTLDRHDASVNSLNHEVLSEFKQILSEIEDNLPTGVVIQSGKKTGFIAGADIEQFVKIKNVNEAISLVREGQKIFDQLEALKTPTVAMINGFCMGGGTELSLACDYRVACDDDKTRLGLPEVKLGIHPGWGGTVRLPRLVGAIKAMDVILSGRNVRAKSAAKMGMVDVAVPERHLVTATRDLILKKRPKHKASFMERMTNVSFVRPLLAKQMTKQVASKARKDHYPAPYAVIKNWVSDGAKGEAAMITEANSMGELLVTPTSRNLVRVFFLQDQMKGLAKGIKYKPKHVHVIGAGTMGGDIAAWCAFRGFNVTLQDREAKFISPAIKRAYKLYKKKLKKPVPIRECMDRLMPDVDGEGVKKADIIIEAIFENLEVKQQLFKDLESKAKPEAILASNTSSIPLDEISSVMSNPGRLVGIHFFNPVAMMPLVEVVKSESTDETIANHAIKFVTSLGKFPVPVKSKPGFLVNRCLMPYMMEAMALLDEGVSGPAIDKAAKAFGMPMGPIELGDTVGLDVCLSVAKNLSQAFGGDVPKSLEKIVESGNFGKKTGKGFYEYKKGKPVKSEGGNVPQDAVARMINRMLNECAACLREGVVDDIGLLDGGMIFGTGFAPFRGGPMKYAQDKGVAAVKQEMQELASKYGSRFKPDAYWDTM